MELFDLLLTVTHELESRHIVYVLTGSLASSYYGQPRATQDADLALRITPAQARDVARALAGRFYISEEALVQAASRHEMTNIIDGASGSVIDLSVLGPMTFYNDVLSRRQRIMLPDDPGKSIWICSPEDVILMKMLWRKDSRSAKQFEDALNVVLGRRNQLEWSYIQHWAADLQIEQDVQELKQAADR